VRQLYVSVRFISRDECEEKGGGEKWKDILPADIPMMVVVLLCFAVVATTPLALAPAPVSTPPFVPVVPVLLPPAPASGIAEVEGAVSGAAVKDVRSVVGRVVDGCA
jgi:hypothetical protein